MRKTARGRSVVGVALLLLVLGYVLATVAPALIGALLLAYVAWVHVRFRDQLDRLQVRVERMPTAATLFQDEPATLRTRLVVQPGALRVEAEETLAADMERADARLDPEPGLPGAHVLVSRVRPRRRGPHRLRGLAVRVGDADGLWEQAVRVDAALDLVVQAPRATFEAGAAVRELRELVLPRHTDPGEWSDEIMAHRPYVPGDATRSIDWKASARFSTTGGLLSRVYVMELERPLVVLLDASRTMRHQAAGPSMLDEGVRFASAVLGASWSQAKPAGFVAFDEYELLDFLAPGKRPELANTLAVKLGRLAPAIALPREASAVDGDGRADRADGAGSERTPFERALAPFLGGARGGHLRLGLHEATAAATRGGTPAFLVVFSDLRHRTQEALNALARVQKHQHRVLAVVPFPPWFRLPPGIAPTADLLESLYREWERHRKVERRLRASGIEVVEASPEQDIRDLLGAAVAAGRPRG